MAHIKQFRAHISLVALVCLAWAACGQQQSWSSGSLALLDALHEQEHQNSWPASQKTTGALPVYVSEAEGAMLGQCFEVASEPHSTDVHGYVQVVGVLACQTGSSPSGPEATGTRGCDSTPGAFKVLWQDSGLPQAALNQPKIPVQYKPTDCATASAGKAPAAPTSPLPESMPLSQQQSKSSNAPQYDPQTTGMSTSTPQAALPAITPLVGLPMTVGSIKPTQITRRSLLQNPDLPSQRAPRAPSSATPSTPAPAPSPTSAPAPAPAPRPSPAPTPTPSPAYTPQPGYAPAATPKSYPGGGSQPSFGYGLPGLGLPSLGSKGWGFGRRAVLQNPDLPSQRSTRAPSNNPAPTPTPAVTPSPMPSPTPSPPSSPLSGPTPTSQPSSSPLTPSTPTSTPSPSSSPLPSPSPAPTPMPSQAPSLQPNNVPAALPKFFPGTGSKPTFAYGLPGLGFPGLGSKAASGWGFGRRSLLQNPNLPSQRTTRAPYSDPAPTPASSPMVTLSPVPLPTLSPASSPLSSPAPTPSPTDDPSSSPLPSPSPEHTPTPSPASSPQSAAASPKFFPGMGSKPSLGSGLPDLGFFGVGTKPDAGWGLGGYRRGLLQNPDLPSQRAPRAPSSNPAPTPAPTPAPVPQPSLAPTTPTPTTPAATPASNNGGTSQALGSASAYDDAAGGFQSGWSDASYNARPFTAYTPAGMMGGVGLCKILPKGAALTLQWSADNTGALFSPFVAKRGLELWAYKGSSVVPPLDVTLVSHAEGDTCNSVNLSSAATGDSSNGWVKFWINLSEFDSRGGSKPGDVLSGCSSQGAAGDLYRLELRNWSDAYDALICIDKLRLLA